MKFQWCRLLPIALLGLGIAGCGQSQGQAQAQSRGGPHGQRPEQPPVPVAVETARIGPISAYYSATATLEAESQAEVLARVGGVVKSIPAEEGDRVGTGQVLLNIENDEYRLRVEQAEANTANLKAKYDRLVPIAEQKLVSAEELGTAENDYRSALADEGLARLNLSYTKVAAPFEGYVVSRLVDIGQTVSNGTPLFQLADFDPLLARFHVPAREFGKLDVGQEVTLVLNSDGTRLAGNITLVSPIIDSNTGTIKLTVEVTDYPAGTRPGDFAQVNVVTEQRPRSLLVPKVAVFTDKGEDVIYVVVGELSERRVVEIGFVDELHAEVLSGVSEGDLVVVKGQRSLRHGAPIKILDGGSAGASR